VTGAPGLTEAVYLTVDAAGHGEVVIGGQVLTAKDIRYLHALETAGTK